MSEFFTPPPRPEPVPEAEQPAWIGPPENELGVSVAQRVLLARTDAVAAALVDVVAYSTGLEFAVEIRLRENDESSDPFGFMHRHTLRAGMEIPDEVFRFGFELADGSKATNVGQFTGAEPHGGPVLTQRGGGGGGRSWSFRYWLWPLPQPGSLTLVLEWPAHSIPLTRIALDADPFLRAAAMSDPLWPAGGGANRGAGGSSTIQFGGG